MGYFGAFGFHPKSTGGGGSGSVTAVGAGTGMNFPTITGVGNVDIDVTKVPYYPAGFINGLAKWNGITWVFDNTAYYPSSNPAGYITGITSADITTALGFTPYSNSNPAGFISGITGIDVTTALGYTPYDSSNPSGYISSITGIDVTTALGYTPYNSTNPSGYISGITGIDVTTALGYTPYDSTNPSGYISSITGLDVTTALGYTPYNSTNPAGYISSITGGDVTTALGYTPVNKAGDTMTGFLILNANPTNPLGAATKQYVDNISGNVNFHSPTYAASTTNLVATYYNGLANDGVGATLTATSNGALNLDGVDFSLLPIPPQPYRVLIWQQSNQIENGIYDVTQVGDAGNPFILTRSADADNSPTGELTYGDFSLNQNGTLYGGYGFIMNATGVISIGVSNITYVQYNVAQAVSAGYGLQELTPNVLSVDSSVILTVANAAITYYPLTNPSGYISGITSGDVTTALGYTPYNSTNPSGYISGITSGDVTSALGYTPYNSSNPSGYISSITSGDVTTALGYTPYNATNPSGYISGITSGDVTTALGYTPYNSTNPAGYISGITSLDVTTALGFTPYDSTNPAGYITSSALSGYVPYTGATTDLNMNSKNVITPQVFGSTVASGFLTLNSTSDATKGKIIFGTSAYDEVNNRLGIGTANPSFELDVFGISQASSSIRLKPTYTSSFVSAFSFTGNGINAQGEILLRDWSNGTGNLHSLGLIAGLNYGTSRSWSLPNANGVIPLTVNSNTADNFGNITITLPSILPTLTSGSVIFSDGTTLAQDNSNFFWNNTTKRLGIGNNTPTTTLDIKGVAGTDILRLVNSSGVVTMLVDNSNAKIQGRVINSDSATFTFVGNTSSGLGYGSGEVGIVVGGIATLKASTNALTIKEGANIVLGTTTGTQVGTATNQKLGFFGVTPKTQPVAVTTVQELADALGSSTGLGLIATSTINTTSGGASSALFNYYNFI